ncbi:MAG: DUF4372 domain-containing protein [Acidobacteriales bacterium]|nr:DUF4372 domain-containing protein [Terriglobales bacterium]
MNRVCGILSQVLGSIPRLEFEAEAREQQGERHARGFTCRQ